MRKAGGGTVRPSKTEEIDQVWTLTHFAIVEPILIFEINDRADRFLLRFTRDHIHIQGVDILPPSP